MHPLVIWQSFHYFSTQALADITDYSQCTFTFASCWNQCHVKCNKAQRFWIPTGRQQIKSQLCQCFICRNHSGKPYQIPDPPPLPKIRTCTSEPFTVTGIDFTGALYTYNNNIEEKVYICLFTCAISHAIHLEVVTDLTVDTLLLAFGKFASCSSLPQIVVSAKSTTYQAAANEIH